MNEELPFEDINTLHCAQDIVIILAQIAPFL